MCVSGPVTIGHIVHEVPQVFQAQPGLLPGDLLVFMGGGVARLADVFKALPQVPVHDGPEVLGVHEAGQTVVVGHDQSAVHGVHPFDGKLHTPAAVQHTGRRVDGIDFFRRHGDLPEGGKLGVGEEKIKVGHLGSPLLVSITRWIVSQTLENCVSTSRFVNRSTCNPYPASIWLRP